MASKEGTEKKDYPGLEPKEAMVHVNLRVPVATLEYYKQFNNYTAVMREVLNDEAERVGKIPN